MGALAAPGVSPSTSAPAHPGDEESGCFIAVGKCQECPGCDRCRWAGLRVLRPLDEEVVEAEIGAGVQEFGDQTLVLNRGNRTGRVDKHSARTEGIGSNSQNPA